MEDNMLQRTYWIVGTLKHNIISNITLFVNRWQGTKCQTMRYTSCLQKKLTIIPDELNPYKGLIAAANIYESVSDPFVNCCKIALEAS